MTRKRRPTERRRVERRRERRRTQAIPVTVERRQHQDRRQDHRRKGVRRASDTFSFKKRHFAKKPRRRR